MSRLNALPSLLLTLSFKNRLGLAVGNVIVFLLAFLLIPAPARNPVLLCLPLVLNAWLFKIRGLLISIAGIVIVQWASYSFSTGSAFLSSSLLLSFFIEALAFLFIGLLICVLRLLLEGADRDRQQMAVDNEKLQETLQAKDQFVANATHELRTSLTSVSGYLDLLDEHGEFLDDNTRNLFLRYAREGAGELVLSVNTILETIRANAETRSMQIEPVAVADIIHETINHLAPQLVRDHPTTIEVDEKVMVYADHQYLCQVIRNLLSNAFKYSPSQSPVVVRAQASESMPHGPKQICISIQDRGPGIPPSEQSNIFQQFVRLERDLAGPIAGSGIGLYTSKQLVEEMGGRIWVESTGVEGQGSLFCFLLPGVLPSASERGTRLLAFSS